MNHQDEALHGQSHMKSGSGQMLERDVLLAYAVRTRDILFILLVTCREENSYLVASHFLSRDFIQFTRDFFLSCC